MINKPASIDEIFFRCSQLSKIMSDGKEKAGLTEKQQDELEFLASKIRTEKQEITFQQLLYKKDWKPEYDLSEGAKSYVRSLVRQIDFDYDVWFTAKETQKGILVENEGIALYNDVFETNHKKNTERKRNEWIQGECDIDAPEFDLVVDMKCPWSKETFPFLEDEIDVGGYEWQGRGYMMLYNRENFRLAFCLVNTPYQLLRFEQNMSLHYVDDIEKELRVTTMDFKRCPILEEKIKYKVTEARRYANWYQNELAKKYSNKRNK